MAELSFSQKVKEEIISRINSPAKAEACLYGLLCCCNELSLSPQSRAKIANASAAANDGTAELMKILQGEEL